MDLKTQIPDRSPAYHCQNQVTLWEIRGAQGRGGGLGSPQLYRKHFTLFRKDWEEYVNID